MTYVERGGATHINNQTLLLSPGLQAFNTGKLLQQKHLPVNSSASLLQNTCKMKFLHNCKLIWLLYIFSFFLCVDNSN